jgi:putative iron-regulated protein
VVGGPGPDALLRAQGDTALADQMLQSIDAMVGKLVVIDAKAKQGEPFDTLIQQGINQPDVVAAIESLIDIIPPLEDVIEALGVTTGDLCQDTDQFSCEL